MFKNPLQTTKDKFKVIIVVFELILDRHKKVCFDQFASYWRKQRCGTERIKCMNESWYIYVARNSLKSFTLQRQATYSPLAFLSPPRFAVLFTRFRSFPMCFECSKTSIKLRRWCCYLLNWFWYEDGDLLPALYRSRIWIAHGKNLPSQVLLLYINMQHL